VSPAACLPLLLAAALGPATLPQGGGAVATSEPHATRAAAAVLAEGGNAVDAAVAAGFALAVTYPAAGNLGGGGFLLYREPGGEAWFLDFREVAPAAAGPDLYRSSEGGVDRRGSRLGWRAVAVPGSVPGLLEAHRRWGRLPRERLLAPAIQLAEEGIQLSAAEHRRLAAAAPLLARDPVARSVLLGPGGAAPPPGTLLRQPALAATLRQIAVAGAEAFRGGEIVDGILAASRAGGGILTAADFRDYQPVLRPVHRFSWRGLEILAASPPSSGGVFLETVLRSLEGRPLRLWGWHDPRTVLLLGEATARAFADRNRWLGDPASMEVPVAALLEPRRLARRRRSLSLYHWTPPARLAVAARLLESEDTTHYSLVDAWGGACAVTTTLNGSYGAKVMAPGGFLMNNEMDDFATAAGVANQFGLVQGRANAVRPGRRPLSSMSPVIVLRDGRVDAVLGSPGGPTILTTVLQVLLHRYLFRMSPEAAVAAPRCHRQDRPATLQAEVGRLTPGTAAWLRSRGQAVRRRRALGDVNAVFRWRDGWRPVADPRHQGLALQVPPSPP